MADGGNSGEKEKEERRQFVNLTTNTLLTTVLGGVKRGARKAIT